MTERQADALKEQIKTLSTEQVRLLRNWIFAEWVFREHQDHEKRMGRDTYGWNDLTYPGVEADNTTAKIGL